MIKDIEVTSFMLSDDIEYVGKRNVVDRYELGHLRYWVRFKSRIVFELTFDLYSKQIIINHSYRNDEQRDFARKEFNKFGNTAKNTKYQVQHILKLSNKNIERVTKIFMIAVRIEDLIKHNSI